MKVSPLNWQVYTWFPLVKEPFQKVKPPFWKVNHLSAGISLPTVIPNPQIPNCT